MADCRKAAFVAGSCDVGITGLTELSARIDWLVSVYEPRFGDVGFFCFGGFRKVALIAAAQVPRLDAFKRNDQHPA